MNYMTIPISVLMPMTGFSLSYTLEAALRKVPSPPAVKMQLAHSMSSNV